MNDDARHDGRAPECLGGDLSNPANSIPAPKPAQHRRPGRKTDRVNPRPRSTLAEPVKVAEFWKNRRGETVRISLSTYEARNLVDVRQYFTDAAGKLMPTKSGIAIDVLRLPDLAAAINKALTKAIELGLIKHGAGE
jgi:hypothetical protein